jgi:hypothetical protein
LQREEKEERKKGSDEKWRWWWSWPGHDWMMEQKRWAVGWVVVDA